jgi:hypothetical protein
MRLLMGPNRRAQERERAAAQAAEAAKRAEAERKDRQQTAVINAIRAHLAEFGIVAPLGRHGNKQHARRHESGQRKSWPVGLERVFTRMARRRIDLCILVAPAS